MTERSIGYGILAGFIATIVLSILMVLKSAMGMMPQLNAIHMLSNMGANYAGLPASPIMGWLMHFFIGAVLWGVLFALIAPKLGGHYWLRGVIFSIGAWVLMMIIPMPMAGAGFFGLNLGIGAPIATLVLHIIFGAVLGGAYRRLLSRRSATEEPSREAA